MRFETYLAEGVQSEDGQSIFQEFKVMKACDHTNIAKVFSAYEVPFPAFTMELLGKTLDQSTTDRDIDNEGVLIAFNDAAAAVQYLHRVKIDVQF